GWGGDGHNPPKADAISSSQCSSRYLKINYNKRNRRLLGIKPRSPLCAHWPQLCASQSATPPVHEDCASAATEVITAGWETATGRTTQSFRQDGIGSELCQAFEDRISGKRECETGAALRLVTRLKQETEVCAISH